MMASQHKSTQNGTMDEVREPPPSIKFTTSSRNLMYPNSSKSNGSSMGRSVWIGGPGTRLPFFIESFLSWTFAIGCLSVALYHWVQQVFGSTLSILIVPWKPRRRPTLPLTTHSRNELLNTSGLERYRQLIRYLESKSVNESSSDETWVSTVRDDPIARRLVSLLGLKAHDMPPTLQPLLDRLFGLWPEFLRLPSLPASSSYPFEISIVTSAYKEDGSDLLCKLQNALTAALRPESIELILVNAGCCQQLDLISQDSLRFARVVTIEGKGGGRGASLNEGAAHAQGRILTFLHADTRLSFKWDAEIKKAFGAKIVNTTTTACAFSFAIDTTPHGLNGGPFPPGIQAIEATANWRTHLFHLPYGDQCLSIPRVYFDYLGGYPHQCLMEDYELVRLLRHRIAESTSTQRERLAILPTRAYCGPRRWQKFGVLYVTYTNSKCVNLYASGTLSPEELYKVYYGVPPDRSGLEPEHKSPWEAEMHSKVGEISR